MNEGELLVYEKRKKKGVCVELCEREARGRHTAREHAESCNKKDVERN